MRSVGLLEVSYLQEASSEQAWITYCPLVTVMGAEVELS